MPLSAQLACW